ncbi:MAG: glycosyltransferase family 4 protein [Bacteroidota bacterium]|nr:glycosyltransferase family 4 protein [Bacteroidota bacterium]
MSPVRRVLLLATGTFDYTISLSNALARLDLEVILAVPENKFGGLARWVAPKVGLHVMANWPRFRSPRNFFFMRHLARWILKQRPDVLHIQHVDLWVPLLLRWIGRLPVVTTLHDVDYHPGDWQSRKTLPIARWYQVRRSDLVIVHAECLRDLAIRKYGLNPNRVHVRPHGIHELYLRAYDRTFQLPPHDGPTVLFFGRIMRYKGLPVLLEANRLLRTRIPNVRLLIAGAGMDAQSLARRYDPEGHNYVIHNRYIPLEQVGAYFEAADVVALPYLEASQSGVAALAYAFGKPVVCTDVGGLPELVQHGQTGLIVPPADAHTLASALAELLMNPLMQARMRTAIAAYASGPLNWDQIARETLKLYESLWYNPSAIASVCS